MKFNFKDKKFIFFTIAVFSFLFDVFTKVVFDRAFKTENFDPTKENWIIPKILSFEYTRNSGISFSLFSGFPQVATILIGILILIFLYFIFKEKLFEVSVIGMGLVIGGSFGNFIDRIFNNGFVLDFFELTNFAVFNFADIFITTGFILALISFLKLEKNQSYKKIRPARRLLR